MKRIFLTTLMTAALGSTGALAHPDRKQAPSRMMGGPEAMFDRVDANKDGVITKEESKAQRAMMFDKMDRNNDGYLEEAEKQLGQYRHQAKRKMHRAERKADRHLELDADKDGKVSLAEFQARRSPMFAKLDTNNDGTISAKEHKDAQKEMFARIDVNGDGFLTADDKKLRQEKHRTMTKDHRAAMDKDADGRISRAEFVDAESPMFSKLDQNGDGQITRDEIKSAPMHGKNKHKAP